MMVGTDAGSKYIKARHENCAPIDPDPPTMETLSIRLPNYDNLCAQINSIAEKDLAKWEAHKRATS